MTTWAGAIVDGADDGHTNVDGTTTNLTGSLTAIGTGTALWRFAGVDVPQGAQIVSATASLYIQVTVSSAVTLRAAAADDVAALTGALATAPRTTASDTFDPGSTGARAFDATAIVQELVDRPGWVAGNALAFTLVRDSGSVAGRFIEGGPQYAGTLTIEYEEGAPPGAQVREISATTVGAQPSVNVHELTVHTDAPTPVPGGSGRWWGSDQWGTFRPYWWAGDQWSTLAPYVWTADQWQPLG